MIEPGGPQGPHWRSCRGWAGIPRTNKRFKGHERLSGERGRNSGDKSCPPLNGTIEVGPWNALGEEGCCPGLVLLDPRSKERPHFDLPAFDP
eukprot:6168684-Pyramimonas_sp.AAC.1